MKIRSIKQMTVQLPSAAQILFPIQNLPNVPTNLTENFNSSEAMSAQTHTNFLISTISTNSDNKSKQNPNDNLLILKFKYLLCG